MNGWMQRNWVMVALPLLLSACGGGRGDVSSPNPQPRRVRGQSASSGFPFEESQGIGTRAPLVFVEADLERRWVVICQARGDTDHNGVLRAGGSAGFARSGDRLKPYLIVGTGPGIAIDHYLGSAADGRLVSYARGGVVHQLDVETGESISFNGKPAILAERDRAESPTCEGKVVRGYRTKQLVRARDGSWLVAPAWQHGSLGGVTEAIENHMYPELYKEVPPRLGPLYWAGELQREAKLEDRNAVSPSDGAAQCAVRVGHVEAASLPRYFSYPPFKQHAPAMGLSTDRGIGPPRPDILLRLCRRPGSRTRELLRSAELPDEPATSVSHWVRECERVCRAGADHCWNSCDLGAQLLAEAIGDGDDEPRRTVERSMALSMLAACSKHEDARRRVQGVELSPREYLEWVRRLPVALRVFDGYTVAAVRRFVEEHRHLSLAGDDAAGQAWEIQQLFSALAQSPDPRAVAVLLEAENRLRVASKAFKLFEAFEKSPHQRLRDRYEARCGAYCATYEQANKLTHREQGPPAEPGKKATAIFSEERLTSQVRESWQTARAWEAAAPAWLRQTFMQQGRTRVLRAFRTKENALEYLQGLGLSTRSEPDAVGLADLLSPNHVVQIDGLLYDDDPRAPDEILLQTFLSPVSPFRDIRMESLRRFGRSLSVGESPMPPGLLVYFEGQRALATPRVIAEEWLRKPWLTNRGDLERSPGFVPELLYWAAIGFLNRIAEAQGLKQRFALIEHTMRRLQLVMAPEATLCALAERGLLLERLAPAVTTLMLDDGHRRELD